MIQVIQIQKVLLPSLNCPFLQREGGGGGGKEEGVSCNALSHGCQRGGDGGGCRVLARVFEKAAHTARLAMLSRIYTVLHTYSDGDTKGVCGSVPVTRCP